MEKQVTIHDLNEEECRELIYYQKAGFHENDIEFKNPFFVQVEIKDNGNGRWESYHSIIVKDTRNSKLYMCNYSEGLTENQDSGPFDNELPEWHEVKKVTKLVEVYEYEVI